MMKDTHNPLLPDDCFVPDAEAHVWEDGRIYLYGSFDKKGKKAYCSQEYHVYSSDNLTDWIDHGISFTSDRVTWNPNGILYAPDCAYKNGIYYLYFCLSDGSCGVASSENPYGPFENALKIEHMGSIDPAVFIDEDGQAYIYWGQFDGVRVAKLKDNMVEIDETSISQPLSVAEHEFHEGSSMRKYNGRYYYVYTDTHRHGGKASCLGYAVSDNPQRGFQYGGVILDNFGCDPHVWNNHGSMECFHGQWYIFYHRSTYGCEFSRRVCAEPITINPDGSIDEVTMTSSGAANAIAACHTIPAHYACRLGGNLRIEDNGDGLVLSQLQDGDTALYQYLSFHDETQFVITLKADATVTITLSIDAVDYTTIHCDKTVTFSTIRQSIVPLCGVHSLQLKFCGELMNTQIASFSFL